MPYQFQFRPYRRRFKLPLQTSHGNWDIREGIILRLTDATGQTQCGEIAPLSWFGSETLEQALAFCQQLPDEITTETILSIPSDLPTCQFGFESALDLHSPPAPLPPLSPKGAPSPPCSPTPHPLTYSALLPTGKAALQAWQNLWDQGYRTFKWKIGVEPIADELKIFELLIHRLPASAKLRLDANGGLDYNEANLWLWTCENGLPLEIEFIEQPLPVDQLRGMQELSTCYFTPIALDESVATLSQLQACYQQGWQGIFVIKPSIAGSPRRLRQFCHEHRIDAVFSSVFETTVGRRSALALATELSHHQRAVGFGTNCWFDQDNEIWLEQLWNH